MTRCLIIALANAIVAFFLPLSAGAAGAGWTDINAPGNAYVTRIAQTPKGTLLAGTDVGTLYRSEDGGSHWSRVFADRNYGVLSVLITDSLIVAARAELPYEVDCFSYCHSPSFKSDLLLSRDDGRTWSVDTLSRVQALTRNQAGTIYGAAGTVMYRKGNSEKEWMPKPFRFGSTQGLNTNTMRWTGFTAWNSRLYAIVNEKLYVAADNRFPPVDTLVFNPLLDETLSIAIQGSNAIASTSHGVYRVLGNVAAQLNASARLDQVVSDSGSLFGLSSGRILHSADSGKTWNSWGTILDDTARVLLPLGPEMIAGGTAGHPLMRAVAAGPWLSSGSGMVESLALPLLIDQGAVYASTFSGLMKTETGGSAWTVAGKFGGNEPSKLVRAGDRLWAMGLATGLWTSQEGSGEWTVRLPYKYITGLAESQGTVYAAFDSAFQDKQEHVLLICDGAGGCRTTQPGTLGESIWGGMPDYYNRLNVLAAQGDTILAADTLLYRSRDGGVTWDTAAGKPQQTYRKLAFQGNRLLAQIWSYPDCYRICLDVSDDLGTTWKRLPLTGLKGWSLNDLAVESGRLYAATDSGAFSSTDGVAWQDMGATVNRPVNRIAASEGMLAAGTADGRVLVTELEPAAIGPAPRPARQVAKRKRLDAMRFLIGDGPEWGRQADGKAVRR